MACRWPLCGRSRFWEDHIYRRKGKKENDIKVYLEDERLTTVEAINIMKQNGTKKINKSGKKDILSAVLILEKFLKRNQNERK